MTYAQITAERKFKCGLCHKETTTTNAMRVHYFRKHQGIRVFEKREAMTRKEINNRYWKKVKAKKNKRNMELRRKAKNVRDYFDECDAKKYGVFSTIRNEDLFLSLKDSGIENSGQGVFAETAFRKGDIITKYEGRIWRKKPTDEVELKYTYQFNNGKYLVGINEPKEGMGLGSFVNRPNRGAKANVCFFESNQKVFIEVFQDIKKGDELLCHYGKGFKI